MGITDFIKRFGTEQRKMRILKDSFSIINGYNSSFSSYNGGVYEMELLRASIHSLATHSSKLNPIMKGTAYKNLEKILQNKPNDIMTTQQFLYRTRTILEIENNCYIIPIYADGSAMNIVGLYPISSLNSQIVDVNGILYLKYTINSKTSSIEYSKVGHLRKHYYDKEFFGLSNSPISGTMDLIYTQNQGIINGIKQSANIRFLAKVKNILKPEDVRAERTRLQEESLSVENTSGVLLYDNKYEDIKPIESRQFIVDDKQSQIIKENVFDYFGVNAKILQNSYNEDEWNAFYEGAIEPFAIQLSQVITSMLFTPKEIAFGNYLKFESSSLQYASNTTKLHVVTQLFDRGFITHNMGLKIFNLPEIEDGNNLFIRREYVEVNKLDAGIVDIPVKNTEVEEENIDDNKGQEL